MFWSFAICGFYCEFGEMVTHQFHLFDDEIYRCNWYLLPVRLQKMHLIFMQNTQQPTIIRGYPNIWCTREIFKMVISSMFCIQNKKKSFFEISFQFSFSLDCQSRIFVLYDGSSNRFSGLNMLN